MASVTDKGCNLIQIQCTFTYNLFFFLLLLNPLSSWLQLVTQLVARNQQSHLYKLKNATCFTTKESTNIITWYKKSRALQPYRIYYWFPDKN